MDSGDLHKDALVIGSGTGILPQIGLIPKHTFLAVPTL